MILIPNGHTLMEPRKIGGTYQTKKVYVFGLCKGISPQNMAKNMVQLVPPFNRILKFPLTKSGHFFFTKQILCDRKILVSTSPVSDPPAPSALRLASKSFFRFTSSLASVGCTIWECWMSTFLCSCMYVCVYIYTMTYYDIRSCPVSTPYHL